MPLVPRHHGNKDLHPPLGRMASASPSGDVPGEHRCDVHGHVPDVSRRAMDVLGAALGG